MGGTRSSEMRFDERLWLFAGGYVYHPRFIRFDGQIGVAWEQQKFQNNGSNSSWNSGWGDLYKLHAKILPYHPYNMELFTERGRPIRTGTTSAAGHDVFTTSGAIFRYRKKPASLTMSYIESNSDIGALTIHTATRSASGSYSIGPFRNSAGYSTMDSEANLSQERSSRMSYYFINSLHFNRNKSSLLTSGIEGSRNTQESNLSFFRTEDILRWNEELSIELPWNIFSSAGYRYEQHSTAMNMENQPTSGQIARENSASSFTLTKRFYNSLTTAYNANSTINRTGGGDFRSLNQAFNANYTKMIPSGRYSLNTFARFNDMSIYNKPIVTDEKHSVDMSSTSIKKYFDLNLQPVNIPSIIVYVNSGPPLNNLILLIKDIHYKVLPGGGAVTITDIVLPPPLLDDRTYEFYVTYSTEAVEYRTTDIGYYQRFDLLNGLISPYYGYSKTYQTLLSGTLPQEPASSSTEIMGFSVSKQPYSFMVDFQSSESNLNPSRSFRTLLNYRDTISANTSLQAQLDYKTTDRSGIHGYSSTTTGMNAHVQKAVPKLNLAFSVGGSYYHNSSTLSTDTYQLSSVLTWRIEKLTITMGAVAILTKTAFNTYLNEQFTLTLSRRLF